MESQDLKYVSIGLLFLFFLSEHIEEVIVIGSAFSNHVLGITQLLIENQIKPTLFLRGDPLHAQKGNSILIQLLVDQNSIHWLTKKDWPMVDQITQQYVERSSSKIFILPEGGSALESLPGALSLPLDICRNERDLKLAFSDIFIDAGTGMMASALILGYHWLRKPSTIHVVLIAGDHNQFLHQLRACHQAFENLLQESCSFPQNYTLYVPQTFASFGSTGSELFKEIRAMAQTEGFLCDPIYTAKLFKEAKHQLTCQRLSGSNLIIHSGGGLSLIGFQDRLYSSFS